MKFKSIIVGLTFFSFLEFLSCKSGKELISVSFRMDAPVPGYSRTVSAEKSDNTYLLTYHREGMEQPDRIEIAEADFRKLENWLNKMGRQGRKLKTDEDGRMETLEVKYLSKGKPVMRRYESTHRLDKKSDRLMENAISLMFELKDNYYRQFEIRIYYSKGIATPTEIYTHVEPSDLVEELGEFLEKRDSNHDKQPGGKNDYSHRWRAVKPGIVKVWFLEEMNDFDSKKLPIEYRPYGNYEIDENLMVKLVKENK